MRPCPPLPAALALLALWLLAAPPAGARALQEREHQDPPPVDTLEEPLLEPLEEASAVPS